MSNQNKRRAQVTKSLERTYQDLVILFLTLGQKNFTKQSFIVL